MGAHLIAITQPVIPGAADAQSLIAYTARVSNPDNQCNAETAPQLLAYLQRERHWSPFEMAHAVLQIDTTRDIARQILRHRSFSFQEFSQRYSAAYAEGCKHTAREVRMQDHKNRQSSLPCNDEQLADEWVLYTEGVKQEAWSTYEWALRSGVAKEVARAVLPEGFTPTRLYMAGTVRSWVHYIHERTAPGTQKEHREIAEECKRVLVAEMPDLALAFESTCLWVEDTDPNMSGNWHSSCGEMWSFIDGGPKENNMTFCHHCGKRVVV